MGSSPVSYQYNLGQLARAFSPYSRSKIRSQGWLDPGVVSQQGGDLCTFSPTSDTHVRYEVTLWVTLLLDEEGGYCSQAERQPCAPHELICLQAKCGCEPWSGPRCSPSLVHVLEFGLGSKSEAAP